MKIAMIFPGQGSQRLGMLDGFADAPIVRETIAEASACLGEDLWQLIANGPPEALNATINTQPVMLAAAFAMFRAWQAADGPPAAVMAGHSLGEYTALTAAGALDFAAAVPLVRFRAQAMQEAVPMGTGAMAVIMGLDAETVRCLCLTACEGEVVEAVNFNDQTQIVIAGHKGAVERACVAAKVGGAKRALPLPVSAPFHSSLLEPAAARLRERLEGIAFRPPSIPVIHNVDVATHPEPEGIRDALSRQAARPVRWVETVQSMASSGVTHVVEVGPGKVLQGLVKRIVPGLAAFSVTDAASLNATLEALA